MTLLTTSDDDLGGILPPEHAQNLIVKPLQNKAVAFDTRVATRISTQAHEFHVPIVSEDASAAWVAEGAAITPDEPVLDELVVTPAKVAALTVVSSELANDSNPSAQAMVGASLARSLAQQVDAAFFGNLSSPAPAGLGSLTLTPVDPGATWSSLDPIAEAISKIEEKGGTATAICTTPAVALALSKLKDETGSLRPLLGVDATNGTARQALGLPIVVSPKVAAGVTWVLDASAVLSVIRADVTLATSIDAYFGSDSIGIRATCRVGFGFPNTDRLVKIWHDPS